MPDFVYTVETEKSVEEAVAALQAAAEAHGFRVLFIHDVQETLAAKGFAREPLRILEVCNAKYAYQVLEADIDLALMLPCAISVYEREGKRFLSTMRPTAMSALFPHADIATVAQAVEDAILAMIEEAR